MARKKTELGDATNDRIVALMAAGGTAESITRQLRAEGAKKISRATIGRRMTELRPRVKKARADALARKSAPVKRAAGAKGRAADPSDQPLPTSPEDIPEDADANTIDAWLKKAEHMANVAYGDGDLDGFGKMGRLTSALLEAKRKATPPKPPDVNERPDMIQARERARDELHKLVDRVLPKGAA